MSQFETIRGQLKQLRHELAEKYHIHSMGLFGSMVRDDFRPDSDIDVIVDFNVPIGIGFIELADLLESRLGKPVDLVSKKGIKPAYFEAIEAQIVYV